MALDVDGCVEAGKLIKTAPDRILAESEWNESANDLASARQDFKLKNWKWATDKAYYSMFHAARGLLHVKGYKERSHACLIIAIRDWFVKQGLLESRFLDYLVSGKKRREDAIYESKYSQEIAQAHITAAEEFLDVTKRLQTTSSNLSASAK